MSRELARTASSVVMIGVETGVGVGVSSPGTLAASAIADSAPVGRQRWLPAPARGSPPVTSSWTMPSSQSAAAMPTGMRTPRHCAHMPACSLTQRAVASPHTEESTHGNVRQD